MTGNDDQRHAAEEQAARRVLDALGARDLARRPWQPAPVPPSATDLVQLYLWAESRGAQDRDAALAALRLLPAARAELDQAEAGLLFAARAAGLTWREMAAALGLNSPQAVQQRLDRLAGRTGEGR